MDQTANEKEHRNPRQIDDGDRALPGEESPDLIEVADGFVRFAGLSAGGRQPNNRLMHDGREVLVEKSGRARYHAVADQVHCPLEGEGAAEQDRQGDEGGNAVARQHPVVDLEHVERPGEHQQVHHGREQSHAPECPAAVAKGGRNRGMRLRARVARKVTRADHGWLRGEKGELLPRGAAAAVVGLIGLVQPKWKSFACSEASAMFCNVATTFAPSDMTTSAPDCAI